MPGALESVLGGVGLVTHYSEPFEAAATLLLSSKDREAAGWGRHGVLDLTCSLPEGHVCSSQGPLQHTLVVVSLVF